MKSTLLIALAVIGMIVFAACSKKEMCTCKTTVTTTGQADITTSTTRELEKDEVCELSVTNGTVGNQQAVVCTLD